MQNCRHLNFSFLTECIPVVPVDNDNTGVDEEGGAGGKEHRVYAELLMTLDVEVFFRVFFVACLHFYGLR